VGELLECVKRGQLTTGSSIELAERTVERGFANDGHGKDVGADVPWLVGDDAQLHGVGSSSVDQAGRPWAVVIGGPECSGGRPAGRSPLP
jgi:hypothetical protein